MKELVMFLLSHNRSGLECRSSAKIIDSLDLKPIQFNDFLNFMAAA